MYELVKNKNNFKNNCCINKEIILGNFFLSFSSFSFFFNINLFGLLFLESIPHIKIPVWDRINTLEGP